MSDILWVAGILSLIVPGLVLWRLPLVSRMDLPARLAIAFAGGAVITSTVLYAFSLLHIPWSRTTVGIPLMVIGFAALRRGSGSRRALTPSMAVAGVFIALTIYGAATARETCADLLYFWGPKGQAFHDAGKIDAAFLGFPHYVQMHADYPPLLPLTYAWASLAPHRFSWWGALYVMPIALAATAALFRGLAGEAIGDERAGWYAALLTAILAYAFGTGGNVGGAAEPMLLLLEVMAIAALTFGGDGRDSQILAAVALAGVAFLKVEGTAFVAVTVLAYLILRRRLLPAIAIAVPAVALIGSWVWFAWQHHLLDSYAQARGRLHVEVLGRSLTRIAREARYRTAYLPWIAALAPITLHRRLGRALLPLLVAAGSLAATVFFYLHSDNPLWWIDASAQRVLLTPLACLAVASAAASE